MGLLLLGYSLTLPGAIKLALYYVFAIIINVAPAVEQTSGGALCTISCPCTFYLTSPIYIHFAGLLSKERTRTDRHQRR